MKRYILIILVISAAAGNAFAQDKNASKTEVQELREKVTELNNKINLPEKNKWGQGIAFDVSSLGLWNEDMTIGVSVIFSLTANLFLRIDADFLWDRNMPGSTTTFGNVVAMPHVGILGRSNMLLNTRLYGGIFVGLAIGLITQPDPFPYFSLKGLGGFEIFAGEHQAFFIEVGGGGLFGPTTSPSYSDGAFVRGGTRIYL
jgi:hypothetical protein